MNRFTTTMLAPAAMVLPALAAVVLLAAAEAGACLAHYRSPEELVLSSPLILVGQVESVEVPPPPKGAKARPGDDESGGHYAVATVRVLRIIKGACKDKTLRVGAGPIQSCASYNCYYSFTKGDYVVLLLPCLPSGGLVCLREQGSLRDARDTELIESCWARAWQHRAEYLNAVKRDAPRVYQDASALAEKLAAAAPAWPKLKEIRKPLKRVFPGVTPLADTDPDGEMYYTEYQDTPETEKATAALVQQLATVKIETIRTALAIACLHETWPGNYIWRSAMDGLASKRRDEIVASRKEYFAGVLSAAGDEKKYVDSYLKAAEFKYDLSPAFPVRGPYPYGNKLSADDYTTGFILSYRQYNRGAMFRAYGMGMDSMKNLQAGRVRDVIPAMCGSKDDQLAHLGFQAIAHRDDEEFLGVIVSAMGEDKPDAWRYLTRTGGEQTRQRRMKALAELGKGYSGFWKALAGTKGFDPLFVDAAAAALKAPPDSKLDATRRKWLAESLSNYLDAAARP